jgi:hypothetical protein
LGIYLYENKWKVEACKSASAINVSTSCAKNIHPIASTVNVDVKGEQTRGVNWNNRCSYVTRFLKSSTTVPGCSDKDELSRIIFFRLLRVTHERESFAIRFHIGNNTSFFIENTKLS